jgi:hypothetical protein
MITIVDPCNVKAMVKLGAEVKVKSKTFSVVPLWVVCKTSPRKWVEGSECGGVDPHWVATNTRGSIAQSFWEWPIFKESGDFVDKPWMCEAEFFIETPDETESEELVE